MSSSGDDSLSLDENSGNIFLEVADLMNNFSSIIGNARERLMENSDPNLLTRDGHSRRPFETTFDRASACRHDYLGSDLQELSGRTVHDEGSILWIPILIELGVMLVPGQTLPLTVFYPPTITMLRSIIQKDKTFGVVGMRQLSTAKQVLEQYGTTAEIYEYQEGTEVAGFKMKAKGQQRFRLLGKKRIMPGIISGKVLILPEVNLPHPLHAVRGVTLDRYRLNNSQKKRIARYDAATSPWPDWVYKQYDADYLVQRVTEEINSFKTEAAQPLPTNPTDLSYWVLQYLSIQDVHRMDMLKFDTPIQRLQYALDLAKDQKIYCCDCYSLLAVKRDVFSMSIEGPQGTYCNPGGHVHEIVTLYKIMGVTIVSGRPSLEYTWFPGYGWNTITCTICHGHMGWLFTAMTDNLKPPTFWALLRRRVTTMKVELPDTDSDSAWDTDSS